MSSSGGTAGADSTDIKIEAVIWQFNRDYPGAEPNDVNLPIKTVYIKTHDGTDWMSKYDPNPNAVSGPDALRNLISTYSFQGIDVAAWFVPYGTDIEGQLQRAKEVKVVWVNPQSEHDLAQDVPAADICAALARHGVKCQATEQVRPRAGVGESLLACAKDMSADLLVMGCYGHTRLRELVFGGASRHALAHMSLPVLMSH